MGARAALLEDGTCIAAHRADRWLVVPDSSKAGADSHHACDGVATPLPPLPVDFDVERIARYKEHVVYFGPSHPIRAKDFSPLLVADGPKGEPVNLESPIGWPQAIGQVSQGIIVSSDEGKLARWDGRWTELKPGGRVTAMAAEPDVIGVIIDHKSVRISNDGGNSWVDARPTARAARTKTTSLDLIGFSNDGELTAGDRPVRNPPVIPTTHATLSTTTAGFRVQPPEGVVALDELSLTDDDLLHQRIGKQCEHSGTGPVVAVSGNKVAVVCSQKVFFSGDLGQNFEELDELPLRTAGAKLALSGNRVLHVPFCLAGYGEACQGRVMGAFTYAGSKWHHEYLEGPPPTERVFALGAPDGFYVLADADETRAAAGRINFIHVDDRNQESTHELDVSHACRSGRPMPPMTIWSAHVDESGNVRIVVGGRGNEVDPCPAYATVGSSGHITALTALDGQTRQVGTFGNRIAMIERGAGEPVFRVSDDGGKSWSHFATSIVGRHSHDLAMPTCSRVGCDFDGIGDYQFLWRWGSEPSTATMGEPIPDAKPASHP